MKEKKENIQKELKELSPFLSQLKQGLGPEGFEAPPRYFKELPDQVMNRLREDRHAGQVNWISALLEGLFRPRLAVAMIAAAFLITVAIYWLVPGPAGASRNSIASLTVEEVQAYVNANLDEFDTELVIEMATSQSDLGIFPSEEFNEENLDQYLDKFLQEVDEETLEEML